MKRGIFFVVQSNNKGMRSCKVNFLLPQDFWIHIVSEALQFILKKIVRICERGNRTRGGHRGQNFFYTLLRCLTVNKYISFLCSHHLHTCHQECMAKKQESFYCSFFFSRLLHELGHAARFPSVPQRMGIT